MGGGGKKEKCREERESQEQKEGREHGKRRHLVQHERHWMEEQKTGRRRSNYMHFEEARRREVKLHKQVTMGKKEEKLVWAGSRWMMVPTLTLAVAALTVFEAFP